MDKATVEAVKALRDLLDAQRPLDADAERLLREHLWELYDDRALAAQDDKKATGKHRLVYNKTTKRIEKVNTVTGLVTESFEPPIECEFAAPGEGNFRTTPAD